MGEGLNPTPEGIGNQEISEEQFVTEQRGESKRQEIDAETARRLEEMRRDQEGGTWQTREQDR
jgi:hypothetical protein